MSLFNPLDFISESAPSEPIFNPEEVPHELDLFYRQIYDFLPEGKTLKDLTPEEMKKIKAQYRFDIYRPGIYQAITGFGNMV